MPLESIFIPTAIEGISWGTIKQRTKWSETVD